MLLTVVVYLIIDAYYYFMIPELISSYVNELAIE